MLTKIFAAGLSSAMLLRMVAPSLVTVISPVVVECKILFIPFGPRVDLTRSPSASAPTKEERRACAGRGRGQQELSFGGGWRSTRARSAAL